MGLMSNPLEKKKRLAPDSSVERDSLMEGPGISLDTGALQAFEAAKEGKGYRYSDVVQAAEDLQRRAEASGDHDTAGGVYWFLNFLERMWWVVGMPVIVPFWIIKTALSLLSHQKRYGTPDYQKTVKKTSKELENIIKNLPRPKKQ